MSTFSESVLKEKLGSLSNSQQSIQTLSLWLIHHRKHAKSIVNVWHAELQKTKISRKLLFVYLANDIVQNSKKKGQEFTKEFQNVMESAFMHVVSVTDEKTKKSMERVCTIWAERGVFEATLIKQLQATFVTPGNTPLDSPPNEFEPSSPKKSKTDPAEQMQKTMQELLKELNEEEPHIPGEMPETEVLVQCLRDLEHSASSDAAVREKIAKLPPEVQDVSLLERIKDKDAADKLSALVNDAVSMLTDYNGRLDLEMDERKRVLKMLRDYRLGQKDQLAAAEKKLEEYKQKLNKVTTVRKELKSHIQKLPDLTLLPDVTGGLPPLPSAGDLFSIDT
ncbi:regulation of nuclear pre-mRNA domain-containing protein 1B-like [Antedon mediterranea]|uniref:regulation of nuclear pre-mRNA domain-containing protein 1B-like n=1 Tax=Antedon mediterranea TaxID=105859 RepID=UPI003AF5906D